MDYIEKTENILKDKTKFKIIKGDWFKHIISLEDKLNRQLRKIKSKLKKEAEGGREVDTQREGRRKREV